MFLPGRCMPLTCRCFPWRDAGGGSYKDLLDRLPQPTCPQISLTQQQASRQYQAACSGAYWFPSRKSLPDAHWLLRQVFVELILLSSGTASSGPRGSHVVPLHRLTLTTKTAFAYNIRYPYLSRQE